MSMNDPLANILSALLNKERIAADKLVIGPYSKIAEKMLEIMKDHGYIKEFKKVEDGKGDLFEIMLSNSINKCNVIKPRFAVNKQNWEKYEKRYLPAKDFGIIIVSTVKGLMTLTEARNENLGGKLIAYCY